MRPQPPTMNNNKLVLLPLLPSPSVCSRKVFTRVFTLPHIPKGSRGCLDLLSRVEGSSSLVLETGDSSSSWSEGSLVVEVWDGVLVEADRIISVSTSSGSSVAEASVPRSKRVLEEGQYRKVYHLGVSPPEDDRTFRALLPPGSSSAIPPSVLGSSAPSSLVPWTSPLGPPGLCPAHVNGRTTLITSLKKNGAFVLLSLVSLSVARLFPFILYWGLPDDMVPAQGLTSGLPQLDQNGSPIGTLTFSSTSQPSSISPSSPSPSLSSVINLVILFYYIQWVSLARQVTGTFTSISFISKSPDPTPFWNQSATPALATDKEECK